MPHGDGARRHERPGPFRNRPPIDVAELGQWLENPGARSVPGYSVVNVRLRDGTSLRGFARGRGTHSLQLQTFDGRFHLLSEGEYTAITDEKPSFMPPFAGTPEERRDLTAFLSRMGGDPRGPCAAQQQGVSQNAIDAILSPLPEIGPPTLAASMETATARSRKSIERMSASSGSTGAIPSLTSASRQRPWCWMA
jgi:hypothetical protein